MEPLAEMINFRAAFYGRLVKAVEGCAKTAREISRSRAARRKNAGCGGERCAG